MVQLTAGVRRSRAVMTLAWPRRAGCPRSPAQGDAVIRKRLRLAAVPALAAAALALAAIIPAPTAAAQPSTPIQHVVVIYLENHSFDSLLGWYCADNRAEGGSRCLDAQGNYAGMPLS